MNPERTWNDSNIQTLKTMWAINAPVREISSLLGLSKNAVIGKAKRIGLPIHAASYQAAPAVRIKCPRVCKATPRAAPQTQARPQETAPVESIPLVALDIPFADLKRRQCRYPTTDAPPHLFCGHRKRDDSPYCDFHHRLCHSAVPPRRTPMALRDIVGRRRF